MPKTKIIATLGPASTSETVLRNMFLAGLDAARFNFSHGLHKDHAARMNTIRALNKKYRRHIMLLADLKGNRIRIGRLKAPLQLKKRQTVFLIKAETGEGGRIPFDYAGDLSCIKKGFRVCIDDGNICLEVLAAGKNELKCAVSVPGLLKDRKGVNIPEARLDFPVLNPEDREDLKFITAHKFDYVAQSFVRNKADILAVKHIVKAELPRAMVISKIEAREALENIDEIIEASDGIMIARGDMGVTFPIWQVPVLQKRIIKKCNYFRKPVITATQMLESMTERKLPTRAEVSDVANAILDGTDYVMLSGETAAGQYPAETVRMMNEIIKYTEQAGGEFSCADDRNRT
ncbi:MAG: pyruvate kinase [Elusimicrobia bacterium]|nr:pyruvate kinase [Elusimicrobiota bacterium]